jgi:allantoinase
MPVAAYISRRVVLPTGVHPAAVLVDTDSGRILRITEADTPGPVDHTHPLGTLALLPGLIDPHVHINAPGRTHWEGFATATRAAAAGGITTVIDMPLNCLPPTTTVAGLAAKRREANGQCMVDWRAWGGAEGSSAENNNQPHLASLAEAGVPGFKAFLVDPGCDGLGLLDEPNLRATLAILAPLKLPLLVHAELPQFLPNHPRTPSRSAPSNEVGSQAPDPRHYSTHLSSRPDIAELEAIRLLVALCRQFRTPIHIVHLSTALALPLLRAARAEGLPITVETCPHYLFFAADRIADGDTLLKCAPPIRSAANRALLWQALADGTIDLVASDHSPCPPEMKSLDTGRFDTAWGGIASLSLGASVLWSVLSTPGSVTAAPSTARALPQLCRLMSAAPARLAGLARTKGQLAPGFDADLLVFDPEHTFRVTADALHFRHPISPYVGRILTGRVRQTILRGQLIFSDGQFPSPAIGREARA